MSVCLSFLICWAPFHIQRLIASYWILDQSSSDSPDTNSDFNATTKEMIKEQMVSVREFFTWWQILVYYATGLLYYSSAAINPILYNVMSRDFRIAFLRMYRCRSWRVILSNFRCSTHWRQLELDLTGISIISKSTIISSFQLYVQLFFHSLIK